MSTFKKEKATSIVEKASRWVEQWSDSKKAAFEQRTGLALIIKPEAGQQRTTRVATTTRKKSK